MKQIREILATHTSAQVAAEIVYIYTSIVMFVVVVYALSVMFGGK